MRAVPMYVQRHALVNVHPGSVARVNAEKLVWYYTYVPHPLCQQYSLKLEYKHRGTPKVYVVNTVLARYEDQELPHVYDQEKQHLCLYDPEGNEWSSSMIIATTIIPWASDWLYHYEVWLTTGDWLGGGRHPVDIVRTT